MQIVIVDNASDEPERPIVSNSHDAEVILNPVNRGFAPAVNQGLQRVRAPYVLLLNPDVYLADGSLLQLLACLSENSMAGAVSPRFWWDSEQHVLLPPTMVPSLSGLSRRVVASRSCVIRRIHFRRHLNEMRTWWFARGAIAVPAISAACVLIPTRVIQQIGPLDPGYPFYYEEVEWSLRARRFGYKLFVMTEAGAVHSFGHSARHHPQRVQRWARESMHRYWRMHYGRLGALLADRLSALPEKPSLSEMDEIAEGDGPIVLRWPKISSSQVLEVSFDPLFESPGAVFPTGNEFRWPVSLWNGMPAGAYYGRLLAGDPLSPAMHWRWHRTGTH